MPEGNSDLTVMGEARFAPGGIFDNGTLRKRTAQEPGRSSRQGCESCGVKVPRRQLPDSDD